MRLSIHFISGLPRSGSTLLAAILRQNPRFQAGMSGPLSGMMGALLENMSARNEFSIFLDDNKRKRIIHSIFNEYYAESTAEVVFDTSRGWCACMPAIADLFPKAKVIACVRDMPWVIDSIERIIQKNIYSPSSIFGYTPGGTVYTRANSVAGAGGLVGYAYDALKQACYGAQSDRLLLVQYESLTSNPVETIKTIYKFIDEPWFEHDFDNVEYELDEFDLRAGTPGLHRVNKKVQYIPRATLLPPDLFQRFSHDAFWRNEKALPKNVSIV